MRRCKNITPPASPAATSARSRSKSPSCSAISSLNHYILAISIGAVFFGANTYIGNGPNFMVKSIADQQNVRTPGFLGLVFKYTLPCMVPMLVLIWLLFFRR